MAIATPEVYAEMLQTAKEKGFAYPAVNVTSSQTLERLQSAASQRLARTASSRHPPVCSILVRRFQEGHGRWLLGLRSVRTRSC